MTDRFVVSPEFGALYYSFYIVGLRRLAAPSRIRISRRGFPPCGHHGLSILAPATGGSRVFISAGDGPGLNPDAVSWCDVFGKVNLEAGGSLARSENPRVLPIGPSFGVRAWGLPTALSMAAMTVLRGGARSRGVKEHVADYYRQWRYRALEESYAPSVSDPRYVFYASRLWRREPETNGQRAAFMRACGEIKSIHFEGGFVPRVHDDVAGFHDVTVERTYSLRHYLDATRRSAVSFNSPAVAGCLGWKLAEFLALGKAIISTPLLREMPEPLVHGENVHFVDGSESEIREAVRRILTDAPYRRRLEAGAREYYDQYLQPHVVVGRLIDASREAFSNVDRVRREGPEQ